jgi:hypothetical protein
MDKKTGMIISIIGSIICLCLAVSCCGAGVGWAPTLDTDLPPILFIILGICLGLIPIIIAVLLWVCLYGRAKDEGAEAGPPPMGV